MKNTEIQGLGLAELTTKVAEEKAALEKLRFAHAVSPIENPLRINHQRKLVARLMTELNRKQRQTAA